MTNSYNTNYQDSSSIENNEVNMTNEEYYRSKADSVFDSKMKKLETLNKNQNQKASLDNSYTDLGNGIVESNKNKIWNDLKGEEFQNLFQYAAENSSLTRDKYGDTLDKDGNKYTGRTKWVYEFGGKGSENDFVKLGIADGRLDSPKGRYIEDKKTKYGWDSGFRGADVNKQTQGLLLPENVAIMLEGLAHGREEALKGRAVPDIIGNRDTYESFGSGGSEYYNNREALYGKDTNPYNEEQGKALFEKFKNFKDAVEKPDSISRTTETSDEEISQIVNAFKAENATVGDRLSNTLKGFGSTFVSELLVNPADALGDITGWYDIGTNEEKTKMVEGAFGYNSYHVQESMEKIGQYWEKATDKDSTLNERLQSVGSGVLEAYLTPEILGTSLGALLAWIVPGGLAAKGLKVGSKFVKAAEKIDTLEKAGKISKAQARVLKLKRLNSVDGAKVLMTKQAGFITSSLGNVNNQYEEFVENNNGKELEGADKAAFFAGRFAMQILNQNLDKFTDVSIMKNPGMVASIVPAIKHATEKEFGKVVKAMAKGVAKSSINATKEAAQEYAQTMMELYNSRYGSEQFSDVNSFKDFLLDERNTKEAGIAAIAGAGGSGQFELVGGVAPLGKGLLKGAEVLSRRVSNVSSVTPTETGNVNESFTSTEVNEEEVQNVADSSLNTVVKYAGMIEASEGKELFNSEEGTQEDELDLPNLRESIKNSIANYDEAISEIEQAEVFFSTDKETNENSLKLLRKSKKEILNLILDDESPVLGSRLDPEDIVSEFLNTVDVENGNLNLTEEEVSSLDSFVVKNDIPPLRFKNMVLNRIAGKDASTVREESITKGDRSSSSYRETIKTLVNTANPNKDLLTKTVDQLNYFLNTQETRKNAFDSVLETVEKEVERVNKLVKSGKKSGVSALKKSLVKKHKVEGYDTAFVKVIENSDGTVEVLKNSKAVSNSIKDTIDHLNKTKKLYGKKVDSILGTEENRSGNTIYIKSKASNRVDREKDQKFVKTNNITKVVVDTDNAKPKWKTTGDYYKDNSDNVYVPNDSKSRDYTENDTVLITSTAKEIKNQSFLSKQLSAISSSGAFLVLDNPALSEYMKQYHMVEVEVEGVKKYVNEKKAEPFIEAKSKKDEEKALLTKKRKRLVNMFAYLEKLNYAPEFESVEKAFKDGAISEKRYDVFNRQYEEILEIFPDDSDKENGKSSTAKIKERYNNQKALFISSTVKSLLETALSEGLSSASFSETKTKIENSKEIPANFKEVAVKEFEKQYKALEQGEEILAEWKKASKENKKTTGYLSDWLKDNVDNVKGVMKDVLDNSIGKGKKSAVGVFNEIKNRFDHRANYYEKVDSKGNFIYDENNRPVFLTNEKTGEPVGYQVYQLDANNYINVSTDTVLNSIPAENLKVKGEAEFNDFLEGSLKLLKSVIRPPNLNFDGEGSAQTSINDLAMSPLSTLIYNKNKEVVPNVAIAINIALQNFIKNNNYLMTKGKKSKKDIAEMLGVDEVTLSKEAVKIMQERGFLYKTAANSIGKDIAALLGISRKENDKVDAESYDALLADFGQTALLMGVKSEVLETTNDLLATKFASEVLGKPANKQAANKATVRFITAKKGSEELIENSVKLAEIIAEILPDSDSSRKEPLFKKPTQKDKDKATRGLRNEKLGIGINKETAEALERSMDTEWEADLKGAREILEYADTVKYTLGYVDIDENNDSYVKLSKEKKEVQESLNRGIEKALSELQVLVDNNENSETVSLWFKYFISKNGRFFIDSNTLQPQNEKQLHRFLMQPKSHKNIINYVKKPKGTSKFKVGEQDVTYEVHYSLAQAFGFKTDKKDTRKIREFGEMVLHNLNGATKTGAKKIQDMKKEFMETGKATVFTGSKKSGNSFVIEKEHFGHAMQAFNFLLNMDKKEGSFSSSLSAEFDAVTNGFGIKLLQMPIVGKILGSKATNSLKDWLTKVGIIFNDNPILSKITKSMNDVLDSGGIKDSYQTLAAKVRGFTFESMLEELDNSKNNYPIVNDSKYMRNVWEALMNPDVLPISIDGEVDSALRNLFKPPFMTFNYAASIKNIRANLVTGELVTGLVDKMSAVDIKDETSPIVVLMKAITEDKKSLEEFQKEIRTEYFGGIKPNKKVRFSVDVMLREMIDNSYGAKVEEILNQEFEPFIQVQDDVNDSFKAMFEVFNIAYENEILEARKNGAVSKNKEKEIYLKLKDKWPMIKGPLTNIEEEFYNDGVGVYDTSTVTPESGIGGIRPSRALLNKGASQKTVRVSHMVKRISEAVAAGSVLPVHYIDGSVMTKLINNMPKGKDVVTIHDAIIPSLIDMRLSQQTYNKYMLLVNTDYSFVNEIAKTMDKFMSTVDENPDAFAKGNIKLKGEDESVNIREYVKITRNSIAVTANKVNKARKELFEYLNKGSSIMHMAGTAEGVYNVEKNSLTIKNLEIFNVDRKYKNSPEKKLSDLNEKVRELHKKAPDTKC